ncbi:hypothetical protein ABCL16_003473 [Vibrio parahaemolyticus]
MIIYTTVECPNCASAAKAKHSGLLNSFKYIACPSCMFLWFDEPYIHEADFRVYHWNVVIKEHGGQLGAFRDKMKKEQINDRRSFSFTHEEIVSLSNLGGERYFNTDRIRFSNSYAFFYPNVKRVIRDEIKRLESWFTRNNIQTHVGLCIDEPFPDFDSEIEF